jgi:DNA-binding transcriptional ArsR family regulator
VKDEMVRVNVLIGREQKRRLFHVLLDEGQSFSEWTRRQIDAYLKEKEPIGSTKRKQGGEIDEG